MSILPLANSASVMMPMVFWASLAPCEKAMNPAEIGCRRRNHVLTGPCARLRTSQMRPVMSSQAPTKPEQRRADHRQDDLVEDAAPEDAVDAGAGDHRADEAAEERVRGARRDAEVPGGEVPHDGADEGGEHDRQGDEVGVDEAFADGLGDAGVDERAEQVEPGGHEDGDARRERARRHRGGDRVGGVVEAVGVVEDERQDDDRDEEDHGLCSGQLCLRTMLSMTLATCSHSSMALSRVS